MRKTTVVHCFARKLDAVCDAYEAVHGPGTFVGSPAHLATFHESWRDGTCLLGQGHVDDCCFTDDAAIGRKERKAS
jgi:hypothetical protein